MPRNFTDKQMFNVLANLGLNAINVANPGQINQLLTSAGIPGGVPTYGSGNDPGLRAWFTPSDFIAGSRYVVTANGTLFGALYQLVKVDSTALASNVAVGKVAYIKNTTAGNLAMTVTDESVATANTEVAGIFLNTITPGNFGVICIAGKVNVLLKSTISNGAPSEGDSLFSGGGSGTVDDLATNVTWTTSLLGRFLGTALALPASNTTIAMQFRGTFGLY